MSDFFVPFIDNNSSDKFVYCGDSPYPTVSVKPVSPGVLWRTRCTVIGPMQYSDGRKIRELIKNELSPLGIIVFDHYNKPFDNAFDEGEEARLQLAKWLENEEYDKIAEQRTIRLQDLLLIDKSDFIIFHFIPGVVTVGSFEEFFLANSQKRPIFFICEGGKKLCPYWIFWTIPHKYIYNNVGEVLDVIKKIDSGEKPIDSDRWKLLSRSFR